MLKVAIPGKVSARGAGPTKDAHRARCLALLPVSDCPPGLDPDQVPCILAPGACRGLSGAYLQEDAAREVLPRDGPALRTTYTRSGHPPACDTHMHPLHGTIHLGRRALHFREF
jgi:hypothetical protein